MLPNQHLLIENVLGLGSPPSALPCLSCDCCWHFHSKGGRTKHMKAKHDTNRLEPQESSSSSQRPPFQDLPREPSPMSSDPATPPPSPSPGGSNADVDMISHPNFEQDEMLPHNFVQESSRDSLAGDDQHDPDPPRLTRLYHPKLDGKSHFFIHVDIN
jgi:hypothetical protein